MADPKVRADYENAKDLLNQISGQEKDQPKFEDKNAKGILKQEMEKDKGVCYNEKEL